MYMYTIFLFYSTILYLNGFAKDLKESVINIRIIYSFESHSLQKKWKLSCITMLRRTKEDHKIVIHDNL
jgi:hypothetical protein